MSDDDISPSDKITDSSFSALVRQITKPKTVSDVPTKLSSALVTWTVTAYIVMAFIFSAVLNWTDTGKWYSILLLCLFAVVMIGMLVVISRQPRSTKELSFTVPFVPWLPALSMLINVYLMTQLDYMTWVRFLVWIFVGLLIYFFYGVFHSHLRYRKIPEDTDAVRAITQSTETVSDTTADVPPEKSSKFTD